MPVVLAAGLTLLLLAQTVVVPTVGLSDQGDYSRVLGPLGLLRPPQSFSTRYVYLHYAYGPHLHASYVSSQLALAWPVVGLTRALGAGSFDLRLLSATYAVLLGAGMWLLLRTLPGRRVQLAVGLLSVVVLGDSAFVGYLGSFYSEPASLVGLVLVVAAVVALRGRRRVPVPMLLGLSVAAGVLVFAKTQDLPLVLPVLGLLVLLRPRIAALGCAAALVAGCVLAAHTQPTLLRDRNLYDSVFAGVLPEGHDPAGDLRALGLEPALARYAGTSAYGPHTGFSDPRVRPLFRRGTSVVLRFYATHPRHALRLSRAASWAVATLRVPYLGQRTQGYGGPPLAPTWACEPCLYAEVSRVVRPAAPVLLPALYVGALGVARALRRRSRAARGLADALVVLVAVGGLGFVSGLGDGEIELVKHMLLVEAATALLAVLTVGALLVRSDRPTGADYAPELASGTSSASTMV